MFAAALLGVVLGAFGSQYLLNANVAPDVEVPDTITPDAVAAAGRREIVGLARLIPVGKVVTVAPPYGAGDARVATLSVDEGSAIAEGQVLAVMDNEASLTAALHSAEATAALNEATLEQTRELLRLNRDQARANLSGAEGALATATADYDRSVRLKARGVVAEATLDSKRAALDQARGEADRLRAALARYDFGDIDAHIDVRVAARNLAVARAAAAEAAANLDKAFVRSPTDGRVLTINVRPGEKPGDVGIMTVGAVATMMAEIEIYQSRIGGVALGDPVTVTAEALPRPLAATVTRIGIDVGRQAITDADPAANTDARVIKVEARLDQPSSVIAARFTNLEVTARIGGASR